MGINERKEREKQKRKAEILKAAKNVFLARGYKNTTVSDIAEKAELSPGTLYLYFKDKSELFTLLSVNILEHMHLEIEEISRKNNLSAEEKLSGIKEVFLDMYEEEDRLLNIFYLQPADEYDRLSSEVNEQIRAATSKVMDPIGVIFKQGIDQGIFRKEHPSALVDIVWVLFSGIIAWGDNKRRWNEKYRMIIRDTMETALRVFLDGIKIK